MTNLKRPPVVRPAFLKLSLFIAVLLLPFVSHAVWDYVEMRRLDAQINAVIEKNEPVLPEVYRRPYVPGESERLYLAATALAADQTQPASDFVYRPEKFDWSAASLATLKRILEKYEEALTFLDRAAELPFHGFRPGINFGPGFSNVLTLAGARAAVRAADGDGDGAIDSVFAQVRARRTMRGVSGSGRSAFFLNEIMTRARPGRSSLERLAAALGEADDDAELAQWFIEQRAGLINDSHAVAARPSRPLTWEDHFLRPWQAHELNWQLDVYARLIAAAREPWPARFDRLMAVGETPYPIQNVTPVEMLQSLLWSSAAPLAILRANRVVVAIERYKRDHNEQLPDTPEQLVPSYLASLPIDPFSGQPLIVKRSGSNYSVYSVSMNRRDDGGAELNRSWGFVFPKTYPPDLGVLIEYR